MDFIITPAIAGILVMAIALATLILNMLNGILVQPTSGIIVVGTPLVDYCKIETAANCIPGRVAAQGTADGQTVVASGSNDPIGWFLYEDAHESYKPATRATAYALAAMAPIGYGRNFGILGSIASGQGAVAKGKYLRVTSAGQLALATVALTLASGSTAVTSSAANGAIISGDRAAAQIVAIALESVDATSAAKDCCVLSLI
jgi:hypothetical protein